MTASGGSAGRRARIVGAGRAGGAFALAMGEVGWSVELVVRGVPLRDAARDVGLLLLCVPDAAVSTVADEVAADEVAADEVAVEEVAVAEEGDAAVGRGAVVAHCAGSLTLDALGRHPRRASIHPLVAMPSPSVGAARLLDGACFGVAASDPGSFELVAGLVADLGGRRVEPSEERRVEYHAAAVVASNHLVALMGQVERIAATAGVPLDAYLDLARGSLANVAELGPAAALTGPVARGDWDAVRRHVGVIPDDERDAYRALAAQAARLAGLDPPPLTPPLTLPPPRTRDI